MGAGYRLSHEPGLAGNSQGTIGFHRVIDIRDLPSFIRPPHPPSPSLLPPKRRNSKANTHGATPEFADIKGLRIVGGEFRGRRLEYSGDPRTRPMKDRVREAVFNLLGPGVRGAVAIDLFAGTGALGLEALSRGAARAVFVERHLPTLQLLRGNVEQLGVQARCSLVASDTFAWTRTDLSLATEHWLVFCSPPYDLYESRAGDMVHMIEGLLRRSPQGSLMVVESDERFSVDQLPQAFDWRVRDYPPARIAIAQHGESTI